MKYLLSVFMLLLPVISFSQPVVKTIDSAKKEGISIKKLDEQYPSGGHINPEMAVFKERQNEFLNEYIGMMKDLNAYLMKNKFYWKKRTRIWQRIYFDKGGDVDFYLVSLKKSGLSEQKKKQFLNLLKEFTENYTFPLTANSNFAQCAPVIFTATKNQSQNKK